MNSAPRKTVVIVDDEKSYADLLAQLLNDNVECSVHVFYRPLEALAAIPELMPSVIVTDYSMPEINGLDFIRQATLLLPESAFVLITGHDLSTLANELANLPSLKAHLTKPFGWRELASEVLSVWPGGHPPKLRDMDSLKT